jgi:hypothetical protein
MLLPVTGRLSVLEKLSNVVSKAIYDLYVTEHIQNLLSVILPKHSSMLWNLSIFFFLFFPSTITSSCRSTEPLKLLMNVLCYNAIMADNTITLMAKSWMWMYLTVLTNDGYLNWPDKESYPFYNEEFIQLSAPIPQHIYLNAKSRLDFYSCCEYWYDCCARNAQFEIRSNLPDSGGGLGLVTRNDVFYEDLEESVYGLLEFVDQRLFDYLVLHDYQSLYISHESDYCIVIGPLSLCNNGRTHQNIVRFPQFKDRNLLTDEELWFTSFRKEYTEDGPSVMIEFEHCALRMHVTNNMFLTTGDQIMVDYGFVTKVIVDLT